MTPAGVMVPALLWSWLWGIPGLVIATPLTAALMELGSELPPFR
jgi:AI-2 transport protein TqsA